MGVPADRTVLTWEGVEYRVGEPMDHDQKDALPVGSTLYDADHDNNREGPYFTKIGHRNWERSDQPSRHWGALGPYNHLRSLPQVEPEPPMDEETVANYKRRFAEWMPHRAEFRTEAHARAARRGLEQLGVASLAGTEVRAGGAPPPEGTVAAVGHPHEEGFTVFGFNDGRWSKCFGHLDSLDGYTARILSYPGDPFAEVPGGPATQARLIAEFNQQVWDVGHRLSLRYHWCSEYERILEEFGIFGDQVLPTLDSFPVITREEFRALPMGSLIARRGADRWHLKHLRPIVGGAGWRVLVGQSGTGSTGMHLVRRGEDLCQIKPLLWHLPEGTRIGRPDHDENVWVRNAEGVWVCGGETRTSSRFRPDVMLLGLP